jgi:hypothetical protein
MPTQENFAPSFIRSKIAPSPSRLMTVKLLTLITSLRPPKSRLAFLQEVRSSATQGPLRFPSTTSLRCDGVSMMEILNILDLRTNRVSAIRLPKPQARNRWQSAETIDGRKTGEAWCQRVSKSNLTVAEIGVGIAFVPAAGDVVDESPPSPLPPSASGHKDTLR